MGDAIASHDQLGIRLDDIPINLDTEPYNFIRKFKF